MSTTAPISDAVPMPRMKRPVGTSRPSPPNFPVKISPAEAPNRLSGRQESYFVLGISLLLHAAVLLSMGLLAIEVEEASPEPASFTGILGTDGDAPAGFMSGMEVEFETGGSSSSEESLSNSIVISEIGSGPGGLAGPGGGSSSGTGDGEGDGEGSGIGMAAPTLNVPGHAVTKGSFSAWTVPEDPQPLKPYTIVIQVRLSEKLAKTGKYRARDITGMVVGTDKYKKRIAFKTTDIFEVKDGMVQLEIEVPAANALVRDTILIQSKLLKEKQTLEIMF